MFIVIFPNKVSLSCIRNDAKKLFLLERGIINRKNYDSLTLAQKQSLQRIIQPIGIMQKNHGKTDFKIFLFKTSNYEKQINLYISIH